MEREGSFATARTSLDELCHDLIEPTATIRWLVRAAATESGQDLRDRLGAIAVAASQIAAICEAATAMAPSRSRRFGPESVAAARASHLMVAAGSIRS